MRFQQIPIWNIAYQTIAIFVKILDITRYKSILGSQWSFLCTVGTEASQTKESGNRFTYSQDCVCSANPAVSWEYQLRRSKFFIVFLLVLQDNSVNQLKLVLLTLCVESCTSNPLVLYVTIISLTLPLLSIVAAEHWEACRRSTYDNSQQTG